MPPQDSFFYRQKQKKKQFLKRLIITIFSLNIICFITINYFFFPVKIKTKFYEPLIKENKTLWAKSLTSKKIDSLERGDFIFINGFENKKEFNFFFFIPFSFSSIRFYNELVLQRVIAFSGEKIKIDKKRIYIDDQPIEVKFLNVEKQNINKEVFNRDFVKEIFVPNNYIFVINPNWQINNDSRKYGFLPIDNIVGKIYKQKELKK